MKIKHKLPAVAYRSDPITPEYQAEVDRSTAKAMRAYERAQRALEAAEKRLQRAWDVESSSTNRRKAISERNAAAELVEKRRAELREIEALVISSPASAQHRGTRSYRPVPNPGRQI